MLYSASCKRPYGINQQDSKGMLFCQTRHHTHNQTLTLTRQGAHGAKPSAAEQADPRRDPGARRDLARFDIQMIANDCSLFYSQVFALCAAKLCWCFGHWIDQGKRDPSLRPPYAYGWHAAVILMVCCKAGLFTSKPDSSPPYCPPASPDDGRKQDWATIAFDQAFPSPGTHICPCITRTSYMDIKKYFGMFLAFFDETSPIFNHFLGISRLQQASIFTLEGVQTQGRT